MYISVVICTYNRADLLKLAIDSLIKQSLSITDFEVIIIDNNSTDNTQTIALEYVENNQNIKYFLEKKVGLSHARNRGYLEAKGDYIAYADDDCVLPTDWLLNAKNVMVEKEPDVLGGPVYPFYLYPKPSWYKDSYELLTFGDFARELNKNEYLIGCNIFLKKEVLVQVNGFDPKFGMTGNTIGYAEESELQIRLRSILGEGCVFYDPKLYVNHLVRFEKMTITWVMKSFYSRGKHNYFLKRRINNLSTHSKLSLIKNILRTYVKIILHIPFGFLFRDRKLFPSFKNFLYEKMQGHIKKLGFLQTYCKNI